MYCDLVCIFLLFVVKCMLIMSSHEILVLSILNRYFHLPHSLKDVESILLQICVLDRSLDMIDVVVFIQKKWHSIKFIRGLLKFKTIDLCLVFQLRSLHDHPSLPSFLSLLLGRVTMFLFLFTF